MNIFDQYSDKIKKILIDLSKNGSLVLPDNLDNITAEIPPAKFNCDISTNAAMIISKVNKKSPIDLANNLRYYKIKSYKDLNKTNFSIVDFSNKVKSSENEIRYFLKIKMYNNKDVLSKNNEGKTIIKKLFNKINKDPKKFISKNQLSKDKFRAISDYISGMTDRYAINLYKGIK